MLLRVLSSAEKDHSGVGRRSVSSFGRTAAVALCLLDFLFLGSS